ncbi:MAG: thioesterase family protein [Myxococcota bacterium]
MPDGTLSTVPALPEALALHPAGEGRFLGAVAPGYDVFGIPNGGYLAALGAEAVLAGSEAPDLFSLTTHFVKKAKVGPIAFDVRRVGGSRRFTSFAVEARQDDELVFTALGSTGDRSGLSGPAWSAAPLPPLAEDRLSPEAGPNAPIPAPAIAERARLRLDIDTLRFGSGGPAELRARVHVDPPTQSAAILASDATPPAVWNALGAKGWVPTVELTCHVRARPAPGPLDVHVSTRHVGGGFLEEDALVVDAEGTLVVQSRQLARWTA